MVMPPASFQLRLSTSERARNCRAVPTPTRVPCLHGYEGRLLVSAFEGECAPGTVGRDLGRRGRGHRHARGAGLGSVAGARGHADLVGFGGETWVLIMGVASAAVVGLAIVRTEPRHPVGWLFLALSATILRLRPARGLIEWGRLARPGSMPATGAVAAVNDATWIPWFVLVALILLLTPTGTYLSPRWRALGRVIVGAGAVAFLLSLVKTDPLSRRSRTSRTRGPCRRSSRRPPGSSTAWCCSWPPAWLPPVRRSCCAGVAPAATTDAS